MKPTPGPWHYQENSDAYTHIVRGPTNYIVHQGPQHTDGVAEANARLIAAAPDLLKALSQMRREWGGFGTLSGETLEQADRAITKAKGGPEGK